MKEKKSLKQFFKDLLFSIFDTPSLLKFGIYSSLTPLIILVITIARMISPNIILYNTLEVEDITTNVVHLEKVVADVLLLVPTYGYPTCWWGRATFCTYFKTF